MTGLCHKMAVLILMWHKQAGKGHIEKVANKAAVSQRQLTLGLRNMPAIRCTVGYQRPILIVMELDRGTAVSL